MVKLTQSTKSIKQSEIKRDWHLIDVAGLVLGRIAPQIAKLLQGKNKATYIPYLDVGDYVVVINSKKVILTGAKSDTKIYTRYSGYPGGLKTATFKDMLTKNPNIVVKHAVSGMLPKNKHRDIRLDRLFVFPDEKHNYQDKFDK